MTEGPTRSYLDADFGRRLKEAREARGYNQTELGKLIGRSREAVNRWERQMTAPWPGQALRKCAEELGVNLLWLTKGEGPRDVFDSDDAKPPGSAD